MAAASEYGIQNGRLDRTVVKLLSFPQDRVDELVVSAGKTRKKQGKQMDLMNFIEDERKRGVSHLSEDFIRCLQKLRHRLENNTVYADYKTFLLKDKLKKMLQLYVDVNNAIRIESRAIVQMDEVEMEVTDNQIELATLFQNFAELKPLLFETHTPYKSVSPVARMKSYESLPLVNTIKNPAKPIEAEIFTFMTRIIREISALRENLHFTPHVGNFTDPIVAQTKLVAKLMMEQFSAKSLDVFLNTLTPQERE